MAGKRITRTMRINATADAVEYIVQVTTDSRYPGLGVHKALPQDEDNPRGKWIVVHLRSTWLVGRFKSQAKAWRFIEAAIGLVNWRCDKPILDNMPKSFKDEVVRLRTLHNK